jgi:hypothetical protein
MRAKVPAPRPVFIGLAVDRDVPRTADPRSLWRATTADVCVRSFTGMLSEPRRFSRIVASVALILAPIVTLAGMLATPWEKEATTASYHDALAAHPTQAGIAALVLHFGYLLLLPAALGIMHLARRSTPKVAHVGGVLAVLGLATLPGLLVTDYYDLALAQHLPRAQSVEIADSAMTWPAGVMLATTIAPMFLGLVTLLVAAVRAGVAKWWAPVAVAVGWILPFASGTGIVPASAGAALIGVALIPIGVKVARMSDQTWAEWTFARTTRVKAPKMAVESAA